MYTHVYMKGILHATMLSGNQWLPPSGSFFAGFFEVAEAIIDGTDLVAISWLYDVPLYIYIYVHIYIYIFMYTYII